MTRILVVDDEPTVRELVRAVLDRDGHETVGAGSGLEALSLLERETFDVVVTDVTMPGLDGLELLERIRRSHQDLPVLIVTGGVDGQRPLVGATEVLYKPFTHAELRDAVARALAG